MSFYDEIKYRSVAGKALKYSIVLMGGEAAYIEGIKRMIDISPQKIEIAAGKTLIIIEGEGLALEELETETAIVKGKIVSVREA